MRLSLERWTGTAGFERVYKALLALGTLAHLRALYLYFRVH